jgi:hypothetical protein
MKLWVACLSCARKGIKKKRLTASLQTRSDDLHAKAFAVARGLLRQGGGLADDGFGSRQHQRP